MQKQFTKMQGLGNDFVLIHAEGSPPPPSARLAELANRRKGIGFDQLLWLEPPRTPAGHVYYRVFNADGSEAEQCGNGARCIARLVGGDSPRELLLEHAHGENRARIAEDGSVSVALPVPEFAPQKVPFISDTEKDLYTIDAGTESYEIAVVSIGNPHAVLRVDDIDDAPVQKVGPALESHSRFPNRANIGFMQVVDSTRIRLRVFERGAGETPACGTGACAAVATGRKLGLLDQKVTVLLPGGRVIVEWEGAGQPIWLTGEANKVFEGSIEL